MRGEPMSFPSSSTPLPQADSAFLPPRHVQPAPHDRLLQSVSAQSVNPSPSSSTALSHAVSLRCVHWPAMQSCVAAQTTSHRPQLLWPVWKSKPSSTVPSQLSSLPLHTSLLGFTSPRQSTVPALLHEGLPARQTPTP